MEQVDNQQDPKRGISRRTIVKGAAWSVPVVAAAAAVPVSAASGGPTITPTNPALSPAGACSPVSGVGFDVKGDTGAALPGQAVTVTLPAGFTWSDGTTGQSRVVLTNANGHITVPDFKTSSTPGTYQIIATINPSGPSAVASLEVTGTAAYRWVGNNVPGDARYLAGIPQNSTALAWNVYRAPNGDVLWFDETATPAAYQLVGAGTTSAVGQHYSTPGRPELELVTYVDAAGGHVWTRGGGGVGQSSATYSSVPAGSTAVGYNTFLSPTGDLYYQNSIIATGVTSAKAQHMRNAAGVDQDYITWVNATGGHTGVHNGTTFTPTGNYPAVPTGSTAAGWNYFLSPTGNLYYANSVIASNVTSATAQTNVGSSNNTSDLVTYVTTSGQGYWRSGAGAPGGPVSGIAGATAVGWQTFLTPGGDLYYGTQLSATGVQSANAQHVRGSDNVERDPIAFTRLVAC